MYLLLKVRNKKPKWMCVWCGRKSRNSVVSLCETHYKWCKPHVPCKTPGCEGYKTKGHYCPKCDNRLKKHGSLSLPPRKQRERDRKVGISFDYMNDMKMIDLMKKYNLSRSGIRYILRGMGIRVRTPIKSLPERNKNILKDSLSMGKKELMLKYRLSETRIRLILRRNNA